MPNKLTADDATFAATLGNWQPHPSDTDTLLSRVTTPTSPAGNNVCQLAHIGSGGFVRGMIPRDIYSAAVGDKLSMEVAYSVPGTNTGTGTLFCQISIDVYTAAPAGSSLGLATSAPFTKGDGWHTLAIPEFTLGLVGGSIPLWVGCSVRFGPWTGDGVVAGDVAYFSDVYLGEAPPVAVGGWGVGMVRMGLN